MPLADAGADYRYLRLADTASLAAASAWTDPFTATLPPAAPGGVERKILGHFDPAAGILHLAPLPLAGATTFRLPVRYVEQRDFGNDVELAVALATARWEEMTVRVMA